MNKVRQGTTIVETIDPNKATAGSSIQYQAAFFKSMSHAMQAERLLKEASVPHKIIPIPRSISTDCGVCIRFLPEDRRLIENALMQRVEDYEIRSL